MPLNAPIFQLGMKIARGRVGSRSLPQYQPEVGTSRTGSAPQRMHWTLKD
ncbi:hypothetical protein [Corynebacterium auriscanis]|nr:hypothetical protein [Corynebacterium auriscanis]